MSLIFVKNINILNSIHASYITQNDSYKILKNPGTMLVGIENDEYYFIQLNASTHIFKINKTLPDKTIIFLKKNNSATAHSFLAEILLQLNPSIDLFSAGELSIQDNKIAEWNLKSGSYWKILNLSNNEKYRKVGLPVSKYLSSKEAEIFKTVSM